MKGSLKKKHYDPDGCLVKASLKDKTLTHWPKYIRKGLVAGRKMKGKGNRK